MLAQAFVDGNLAARQLPHRPVDQDSWPGHQVVTRARRGIPHRYDRLTYLWAATQASRHTEIEFDLRDVVKQLGVAWSPAEVARSLERLYHSILELTMCVSTNSYKTEMATTFESFYLSHRTLRGAIRFGSLFRNYTLVPVDGAVLRELARRRALRTFDLYLWQETTAYTYRHHLPHAVLLETVLTELACERSQNRRAVHDLRKRQRALHDLAPSPHLIDGGHFILHHRSTHV